MKSKRPRPLAPPPATSRKKARKVTTLFHKYTHQKEETMQKGAERSVLEEIDAKIEAIGGRKEYQRASQVSTSFFSTSKWVLGHLARNGWLYGIRNVNKSDRKESKEKSDSQLQVSDSEAHRKRRVTRLLEVGAINTELLDAANTLAISGDEKISNNSNPALIGNQQGKKKYRLSVRAIDIHSMHPDRIEEADFLQLPVISKNVEDRYDVVVCSMVLNCVPTPEKRGDMVARLYHHLRPEGILFLTIPKSCLTLSSYMDQQRFENVLKAVGFELIPHSKESPKISFFVCRKPKLLHDAKEVNSKWTKQPTIRRGKKYRNTFAVKLSDEIVAGTNLEFSEY